MLIYSSVFQDTQADTEALIERYIEMYRSLEDDGNGAAKEAEELRKKIELAQKKKSKLLGYNATGQISDRDFLSMNAECDREIEASEQALYELEQAQLNRNEFQAHLHQLRETMRNAAKDAEQGIITRDFVEKYIDRIFVTPEEDKLKIEVRIFSGEKKTRYLERLERRSGHIFKTKVFSCWQLHDTISSLFKVWLSKMISLTSEKSICTSPVSIWPSQ